jgi:hypothetical protein
VLEAPDVVRVARLVGRGDPFDQIGGGHGPNADLDNIQRFADIGLPQAQESFTHLEEQALLELVRSGSVTAAKLRDSLEIVLEERRSYDPEATSAALLQEAPYRTLMVDTQQHSPEEVAALIMRFVMQRM